MIRSFMIRLFFSALLFLFILPAVSGQTGDSIKVRKIKWEITITAEDTVFWIGRKNVVVINVKGGSNYAINVRGGTIARQQGKYIVQAKEEGAVLISVYEDLPEKKKRVLYTKLFTVQRIPKPQFFVCGVKADSVIDKQQIIADNIVTAYHPFYKVNLPVVGFDVIFRRNGNSEKLSSQNNHFTIDMRKRIYSLRSGSLLYFENVYYLLPDGTKEKIENFEVYISETNKYKVGYRIIGL